MNVARAHDTINLSGRLGATKLSQLGDRPMGMPVVIRNATTVGGVIPWVGERGLRSSIRQSLLPDCGCQVAGLTYPPWCILPSGTVSRNNLYYSGFSPEAELENEMCKSICACVYYSGLRLWSDYSFLEWRKDICHRPR